MVRWAQESVIEDPELVRAMFVLLHRQYDGIGGQVGPLHRTEPVRGLVNQRWAVSPGSIDLHHRNQLGHLTMIYGLFAPENSNFLQT